MTTETTETTNITSANAPTEKPAYVLHTDSKAATLLATATERTIVANFKNPARRLAANIDAAPWKSIEAVPEQYRGLLDSVLTSAAKGIVRRYASSFTIFPSSIPRDLLTEDAILSEAAGNNSEWMSKEELQAAWEASATRKAYVTDQRYAASKEFRTVVNYLADLYLRSAGKTSAYKPEELDLMVAKLREEDHDTDFGAFIFMRVEQLKNRKQPATTVNLDLL